MLVDVGRTAPALARRGAVKGNTKGCLQANLEQDLVRHLRAHCGTQSGQDQGLPLLLDTVASDASERATRRAAGLTRGCHVCSLRTQQPVGLGCGPKQAAEGSGDRSGAWCPCFIGHELPTASTEKLYACLRRATQAGSITKAWQSRQP